MEDRTFVFCSEDDQKLFIASREGATLHEVALPFVPFRIAASTTTIAMVCNAGNVRFIGIEAGKHRRNVSTSVESVQPCL